MNFCSLGGWNVTHVIASRWSRCLEGQNIFRIEMPQVETSVIAGSFYTDTTKSELISIDLYMHCELTHTTEAYRQDSSSPNVWIPLNLSSHVSAKFSEQLFLLAYMVNYLNSLFLLLIYSAQRNCVVLQGTDHHHLCCAWRSMKVHSTSRFLFT